MYEPWKKSAPDPVGEWRFHDSGWASRRPGRKYGLGPGSDEHWFEGFSWSLEEVWKRGWMVLSWTRSRGMAMGWKDLFALQGKMQECKQSINQTVERTIVPHKEKNQQINKSTINVPSDGMLKVKGCTFFPFRDSCCGKSGVLTGSSDIRCDTTPESGVEPPETPPWSSLIDTLLPAKPDVVCPPFRSFPTDESEELEIPRCRTSLLEGTWAEKRLLNAGGVDCCFGGCCWRIKTSSWISAATEWLMMLFPSGLDLLVVLDFLGSVWEVVESAAVCSLSGIGPCFSFVNVSFRSNL